MDLTTIDLFNYLDRIQGFFARIYYANYKRAYKEDGPVGVAAELAKSITGLNTYTFRVRTDGSWSGSMIENFLDQYENVVWGRRVTNEHYIFSTRKSQANWMHRNMACAHMPLDGPDGPEIDQRNYYHAMLGKPPARPWKYSNKRGGRRRRR